MVVKKRILYLFVVFFLADHCLWLVNSSSQSVTNELCWLLILLMFFGRFGKNLFHSISDRNEYIFTNEVLFVFVLAVASSLQAYLLHGQSLIQGILPQRFMVVGFLLYYVLVNYMNCKQDAITAVKKLFAIIGYMELLLYITQYFLIGKIQFLQMSYSYRLGEVRMNFDSVAVPFVVLMSVDNIYKEKRASWKDILSIAAGFFYSFVVAKTRIVLVAYIVALVGGYLAWRKGGRKKFYVFFALVAMVLFLSQTELFRYMLDGLNNIDLSAQTRTLGREYYLSRIKEHPFLGAGYLNMKNATAMEYSGMNNISTGGIYWVDLGVYGLTFFFGIIGLIWFLILYGKMTLKSYRIAQNGNLTYWMYMLYLIVLSPNGTGFIWYISSTVSFIVWLSLIDGEYKKYEGAQNIESR